MPRKYKQSLARKANSSTRRLSPELRRAEILRAALTLLEHEGLDGFSLEAVAREAGVALSLPRHYFGGTSDLLKAATKDVLKGVERMLLSRDLHLKLEARLTAYLDILQKDPWGHEVWVRSEEFHPDIASMVRKARCRMAENIYGRPWKELSEKQQYDSLGRIGYIETVVSEWLRRGARDREAVVAALLMTFRQARWNV